MHHWWRSKSIIHRKVRFQCSDVYVLLYLFSGFLPPSGGTAIVNGYDIREDIGNVRSSLGLCPQHDVLFDTMTVEEHLIFFAKVWINVYYSEIFSGYFIRLYL